MTLVSGKVLWSIICGHCVLASDEVVGEELETAAKHLQEGLLFYKNWSEDDHKSWCIKSKLKKEQQEFVSKVGKLLDLCSEQAWEVFQLFVQHEYKGSVSQFHAAASSDREETSLLHQVFSFHLTDPLHLLSCRRHILAADGTHPYEKLFKEFIDKVLDPDHTLGAKLVSQLKKISSRYSPQSKVISPHLPPNATRAKISFQLSAIRHQLATLLIYHGSGNPCSPESVCTLIQLAQGIGIGRDLLENVGRSEKNAFLNQLEAIEALHSFLLALVINADSDTSRHPLCSAPWVDRLNPLIHSLGSKPWHNAPILAWAVLQGRKESYESTKNSEEVAKYSRLAERAIKGNIFLYLQSALKLPAFETDHLLLATGASITYSLICIAGTCFDIQRLGLMPQIHQLAKVCLAFEPTSYLFWNEEEGGASVLLPSALEVFPHSPSALLDMTSSLAAANQSSAAKVVELMSELENFTWPLTMGETGLISASGNKCVARQDIFAMPGFPVYSNTHGVILNSTNLTATAESLLICWQMPTNGWKVLGACIELLQVKIDDGLMVDSWCLTTVVEGLHLLSSILRSDPSHLSTLDELRIAAHKLLISVSQVLKPNDNLVSSLFEFFAQVTKGHRSGSLWFDLDGCALLPSLPVAKKGCDPLTNYRAGHVRTLVCGIEAKTSDYSILRNLCTLVEESLKVRADGIGCKTVRGIIVFVVKEVVPVMLLWRCSEASVRILVIEKTLSLLHHALEMDCVDSELQELIANELSTPKRGAGATLKSVLESSASLQATLDHPAEWPHSSHAMKLTRLAKLALSLIHRMVGRYLHSGERLSQFFLEGTSSSSVGGSSMSHGVWVTPRAPHLALTIAYFVYHRVNPRLPYLALRTLTRLAKEMRVPLVACLGTEAEGLRDCLLSRLDAATEDLWVKVALLRLLTFSTLHQPGLTRLFLTPPPPLLDSVVTILSQQKQSTSDAGMELLLALLELVASLWENNVATATSYLKGKGEFWESLSFCLTHNTPRGSLDVAGELACAKKPMGYARDFGPWQDHPRRRGHCEGEVNDGVIGCILKVYSLELFGSDQKMGEKVEKNLAKFIDPKSDFFSPWMKYIFMTYIEKKVNSEAAALPWKRYPEGATNEMLENCIHFLVIVLMRSPNLLTDAQKILVGVSVMKSLLHLFESSNESSDLDNLQILLADIHLSLVNNCGRVLSENEEYLSYLQRLLSVMRSSVLHTGVRCQVMVLAGILKTVSTAGVSQRRKDISASLISPALMLVEQHCVLSSFHKNEKNGQASFVCSSASCLALACTLLYLCLDPLQDEQIEGFLESSDLIQALLQASVKHTELGNSIAVCEIYRLLSLLARSTTRTTDLNTHNLATSVTLVLSPQAKSYSSILADVLWCCSFCLRKEGAAGLEGAVGIAAVHITGITAALATPETQPELALAAASLAATIAPFHQLWRVLHQGCFEQLLLAIAGCIHRSIKMLHLKETLEREICENVSVISKSVDGLTGTPVSPNATTLINQLLQILSTCLGVIIYLSPNLTDLLCCPGTDLTSYTFELIQPSIRRQTGNMVTIPNLATFADALDLYHTLIPKDGRHNTPVKNSGSKVDVPLLTQCTEKALYVFMTYSAMLILCPDLPAREAREIRTFLADETSTFFSHWFGRRTVASSSLPPLSPKMPVTILPYFSLCRQLVTSLCNLKNEI